MLAYNDTSESWVAAGNLLIYTRNYKGPKILPCGTQKVTGRSLDNWLPQEVCWFQLHRYRENLLKDWRETPTDYNLDIKIPWLTVSIASIWSRNAAPQVFPFSMVSKTSFAKPDNAVAVEHLQPKPKYSFEIKLFESRYSSWVLGN